MAKTDIKVQCCWPDDVDIYMTVTHVDSNNPHHLVSIPLTQEDALKLAQDLIIAAQECQQWKDTPVIDIYEMNGGLHEDD